MTLTEGALQVESLTPFATPYLTPASIEAISRKSTQQVIQVPGTMDTYVAIYIARKYKSNKKEEAAKFLASQLNKLTEKGLVHSVLAPPGYIDLYADILQDREILTFLFPLVPSNRMDEVDQLVKHASEGSIMEYGEEA